MKDLLLKLVTPVVDTSAYADGDVISTATEVANAVLATGGTGKLDTVILLTKDNVAPACELWFFTENPANSLGAVNAAFALNDADLDKCLGWVAVATGDWKASGTNNQVATKTNVEMALKAKAGSQSIYMVVVARGSVTFTAASNLMVRLGIEQT